MGVKLRARRPLSKTVVGKIIADNCQDRTRGNWYIQKGQVIKSTKPSNHHKNAMLSRFSLNNF